MWCVGRGLDDAAKVLDEPPTEEEEASLARMSEWTFHDGSKLRFGYGGEGFPDVELEAPKLDMSEEEALDPTPDYKALGYPETCYGIVPVPDLGSIVLSGPAILSRFVHSFTTDKE
jgi:hypothetical protein